MSKKLDASENTGRRVFALILADPDTHLNSVLRGGCVLSADGSGEKAYLRSCNAEDQRVARAWPTALLASSVVTPMAWGTTP